MTFELTRLDEYPRHQTGATFDVVASDSPHWSDGYYFTLGDTAGAVALFAGLRLYPNTDVMDAFTCVASRGRQHNMRWSRRLRPRIDDLECGSMRVEIIEGLRRVRTVSAPNRFNISYDLVWEGLHAPYNEAPVRAFGEGRLLRERSNYDQGCTVTGWLNVDGRRWSVARDGWAGVRDHSWGLGHTGGPTGVGVAPPRAAPSPMGLRQWALAVFADRSVFFQFHRSAAGALTMCESRVLYPYGDSRRSWAYEGITEDLVFAAGHRRLRGGTITLARPDGGTDRFGVEVISDPVYLQGGGYWQGFDDGLGRGVYRGEDHGEGEVWSLDGPTDIVDPKGLVRRRPDAWAETFARFTNVDDPADRGLGHLECVVSGPYPGFG